jgi:hypothetical protein
MSCWRRKPSAAPSGPFPPRIARDLLELRGLAFALRPTAQLRGIDAGLAGDGDRLVEVSTIAVVNHQASRSFTQSVGDSRRMIQVRS